MDILYAWLKAFGALWTSPFYYLAALFLALHLRKQTAIERKLFSVKLHSWWREWVKTMLWGAVAGVLVSVVFLFLGASLEVSTLIILWVIALILSLVRVRYFCFAYAAGVLGLLQVVAGWIGDAALPGGIALLMEEIRAVHMPSVLALVGVLHLTEAALVYTSAGRLATPLFFEGKRGKPVGGYRVQGLWPVPMLLLVPLGAAAGGVGAALPWPTLFGGPAAVGAFGVLAFPVLIGFQSVAMTKLPASKMKVAGLRLAGYGIVVILAGIAAFFVPGWWTVLLAALLCFGLHEWISVLDRREETLDSPYFVHDARGLKVLAVLPGSAAAELGIEPGYVLRKVNGQPVRDRAGLHAALQINPAFAKLEVLNHDGESRFMQRAMYANEHHQLGIILCPDEHAMYVAEMAEGGLFSFMRARRSSDSVVGAASPLALPPASSAKPPVEG